jgi:hypothetical protein
MRRLSDSRGAAGWAAFAAGVAVALLLAAAPAASAQEYALVGEWGSPGGGDGQFRGPTGITTDQAGDVYVTDGHNHRVQRFTSDGRFITKWGNYGSNLDGYFVGPSDVATDQAGDVYVTDTFNSRVQKFTSSGQFITKWGTLGSGDGEFRKPLAVATDQAGNVYVLDAENSRVQKFTSSGQFITKWGSDGHGDGQIFHRSTSGARGIATDRAGNVYVADTDNSRIQKFTSDGEFITKWGGVGTSNGRFRGPTGVATDPAGSVFVVDTGNARIQKFTSNGRFVTKWASGVVGVGRFDQPGNVATDAAGNVYVADNRWLIQKFAPYDPPVAGRTAVGRVLSGEVLVSRGSIRQTRAQASQGSDLVPLTGPTVLAIGALVDAARGALELLTAANLQRGTQKGEFSNGKFKIRQKRSSKPVAEVVLNEKLRCGKAKTGAPSRSLDANARGRYRVVGRFATGSPHGRARWTTRDTCRATSIKVQEGKVTVRDLVKRRNVVVKKGRSYRARKSG